MSDQFDNSEEPESRLQIQIQQAERLADLGFWEWDMVENCLTYCSEGYARILGTTVDECVGMSSYEDWLMVHPMDRNHYRTYLDAEKQTHPGSESTEIEYRIITPDGSVRHIYEISETIKNESGEIIKNSGTLQDITNRKRLDEELIRMEKLETVGVLAGGFAHDLNDLLTAILGELSLAKSSTDPEDKKKIAEAERISKQVKSLTKQLLVFSKGGTPIRETVDLRDSLRDWIKLSLSGSNVAVEYCIADDLRQVDIDTGQINQVINNLVMNAKESMPEGGTVRISADNIYLDGELIKALEPGSYFKIVIQDEGIGIPRKIQRKVFDPFFTTKSTGSGLGLATSQSIIAKHNGYIDVESTLGVGTSFVVYLPISKDAELVDEEIVDVMHLVGEGNILVMDDEELIREFTAKSLGELGYTVTTTKNGPGQLKPTSRL